MCIKTASLLENLLPVWLGQFLSHEILGHVLKIVTAEDTINKIVFSQKHVFLFRYRVTRKK